MPSNEGIRKHRSLGQILPDKAKDHKTGRYAFWANPKQWTGAHAQAAHHAGKVNVHMVDGHVESLTLKELQAPDKDYTMFKK